MINYTPQNQIKLEFFKHPFGVELDKENRWVKLSAVIPWDRLAEIYGRKLQRGSGRKSVNIRTVLAALIIKHKLNLDDRGTIQMIKENVYLQFFCGLEGFTTKDVFDPSLFVNIRKRLGGEEFDRFNRYIIEQSEHIKPHQARIKTKKKNKSPDDSGDDSAMPSKPDNSKNKGTLKVDATVVDQEMKYPNDVGLLNDSRKQIERMIKKLYDRSIDGSYPRLYPRKAQKEYLIFSKKRRKSRRVIRRAIKGQLQYLRRDLKVIDRMLCNPNRNNELSSKDLELLKVIKEIYRQQKYMYENNTHQVENRIVSLYQWWVRPIVRGKDRSRVEFGAKINVSEVNGFCRINQFSWDAFNEGVYLEEQVEDFRLVYGCYPEYLLADKIYMSRKNRKYLKTKGIKIVGKPLGRPPKKQIQTAQERYRKKKKAAERNHIEGKFGQGKRGYLLNNIKARLPETSESWINAIFFIMNLTKLVQVAEKYGNFFVSFLKRLYFSLISTKEMLPMQIFWTNSPRNRMARQLP